MVVEYFTKATTAPEDRPGPTWSAGRTPPRRPDGQGGHEDVLVEGVKRVDFAYWDSDKKDWADEVGHPAGWSGSPSSQVRVRIGVVALDETGKEVRYQTQARIVLNTEIPRF